MQSQTQGNPKENDPKYFCSYCRTNANGALGVFCIKKTIWFEIMPELPRVNACELCVKGVMREVLNLTRAPLDKCFELRTKILQRKITHQYIDHRTSRHIILKLFTEEAKRRSESQSEGNDSKRQKLDVSHESGNTTTLRGVRGSLVGGGGPSRTGPSRTGPRVAPLSEEENSDVDSQSQESQEELPQPGADIPINDDESSGDEDESEEEDYIIADDEDGRRDPGPSSAAPFQVPRMRQPQEDGTRLTGA